MSRRSLTLFFLLLVVPTLVVAAAAFALLRHERDRITRQARDAQEERLRAVAESVQLAVATVEDELAEQLRAMPVTNRLAALLAWRDQNPFLRHVFIWSEDARLQYPRLDPECTAEERRFVARYAALFTGRTPWEGAGREEAPPPEAVAQRDSRQQAAPAGSWGQQQLNMVEQVRNLRRSGYEMAETVRRNSPAKPVGQPTVRTGEWIPWLSDNRLSLLGWTRAGDGAVYGVELEFAALLSRIVAAFPTTAPKGCIYAIRSDDGKVAHRVGEGELPAALQAGLAHTLAPYLPHWDVAAFFPGGIPGAADGASFVLLWGVLLAIFIATILTGGTLLLRQAHLNLRDALQKTTFVSNVSHELKTPLTSIRMYAELLSQDRVRDASKRTRYLSVIVEESERLTRLVNNVLDFSRLEQRRKTYHPQEIELGEFVKGFADLQRVRIEAAGMSFSARVPDAPCRVRLDRDSLEQALLNLTDNAIKYAAEGRELAIELQCGRGEARLGVCDRGPGIATRHRARIFEKFYRIDDSITANRPGAGLGLSIARALLRDQGGDVAYEPREGGGSCFVIRLPAATGLDEAGGR